MNIVSTKTIKLSGTVIPPSSKSQTIRGLIVATLASGTSILKNPLNSDDTQAAIDTCRRLGVQITEEQGTLIIESPGAGLIEPIQHVLNTRNSGITTRFVMPVLGLRKDLEENIIVDCGEQMKKRPISPLIDALNSLGMNVRSNEMQGNLPVSVSGTLIGGATSIDGMTSQYISALLLSLPCAKKDSIVTVEDLHERPYVLMTRAWLDEQNIGYSYRQEEKKDIYEIKGGQKYHPIDKMIPGDFSSASYLIAAGVLINGEIELQGLDMDDHQGDKRLVYILQEMGAQIEIYKDRLRIYGGKKLHGIIIDANDIPDMVPTLAVVGTQAQGVTEIINVEQARIKETDRIHSMTEGLTKMGAKIEEKKDGLVIYQSPLHGTQVHGYDDHRTVMALSLAGMLADGETIVDTGEAITKTFPNYVEVMQKLGANIFDMS